MWRESQKARASNCVLVGSSAFLYGGAAFRGALTPCVLAGNSGSYAGGSAYGALHDCALLESSAGHEGGGCFLGSLKSCVLKNNSAAYGGGALGCTLDNCCTLNGQLRDRWRRRRFRLHAEQLHTCRQLGPSWRGRIRRRSSGQLHRPLQCRQLQRIGWRFQLRHVGFQQHELLPVRIPCLEGEPVTVPTRRWSCTPMVGLTCTCDRTLPASTQSSSITPPAWTETHALSVGPSARARYKNTDGNTTHGVP